MTDPTPLPDWTSAGAQGSAPTTPAGWYADPSDAASLRYWDGTAWTAHQSAAVATQQWAPTPSGRSFGFGESVSRAFRRWSDFSGRATQSEFWWFYLFQVIASFVLYIPLVIGLVVLLPSSTNIDAYGEVTVTNAPSGAAVAVAVVLGLVILAAYLVLFVVSLALSVRRLHDTDKPGWWVLISFVPFGGLVLLYFWILPSTPGQNQYGAPSS